MLPTRRDIVADCTSFPGTVRAEEAVGWQEPKKGFARWTVRLVAEEL